MKPPSRTKRSALGCVCRGEIHLIGPLNVPDQVVETRADTNVWPLSALAAFRCAVPAAGLCNVPAARAREYVARWLLLLRALGLFLACGAGGKRATPTMVACHAGLVRAVWAHASAKRARARGPCCFRRRVRDAPATPIVHPPAFPRPFAHIVRPSASGAQAGRCCHPALSISRLGGLPAGACQTSWPPMPPQSAPAAVFVSLRLPTAPPRLTCGGDPPASHFLRRLPRVRTPNSPGVGVSSPRRRVFFSKFFPSLPAGAPEFSR